MFTALDCLRTSTSTSSGVAWPSRSTARRISSRCGVSRLPLLRSRSAKSLMAAACSLALQPGPQVRLQLLAHGGHVVGIEQVALDVPVEALAGRVVLGGAGAGDRVGDDLEARLVGVQLTVPDLDEAGVVGHHHLERAVLLGAEEPGLLGGLADHGALGVLDPGPAHEVDERAAVLLEQHLLTEVETLDGRVVPLAVAAPGADDPGQRRTVRVDVVGDLERHGPSLGR